MAKGNNRAGKQPRAHFQMAGGSLIKFRHPYFAGQIDAELGSTASTGGKVDEIDISSCCKLEGRFFEANQNMDSAKQVVLVDSSVVTICNTLQNGTITIPAIKTSGLISEGDFIAGCQLIRSVGDSVGGILTKTDFINGKAITRVYYGVTVQRCPDDVSEGNDVAVYNVSLLYSGWIEAISTSTSENEKRIWAVGSSNGIEGFYTPYEIQNSDGKTGSGNTPIENATGAPEGITSDDTSALSNNDVTDGTNEAKVYANAEPWNKIVNVTTKLSPTVTP